MSRIAKNDGDGFANIVEGGISHCPKCGSTRDGAMVTKCPYCCSYFCTDCSPNLLCPNYEDGRRHDNYEFVPIGYYSKNNRSSIDSAESQGCQTTSVGLQGARRIPDSVLEQEQARPIKKSERTAPNNKANIFSLIFRFYGIIGVLYGTFHVFNLGRFNNFNLQISNIIEIILGIIVGALLWPIFLFGK